MSFNKILTDEEIQIARETVGYLLSKSNELRYINKNQNGMFKERATVLQKLIDALPEVDLIKGDISKCDRKKGV